MNILVIGQGGREHAIAWKIAQSDKVQRVYVAPGNAGTANEPKIENINIKADDITALLEFAKNTNIDLTIVGPEQPLVLGIVDLFEKNGLAILGPSKQAAQLEGSKAFCKKILTEAGVPTASYEEFTDKNLAFKYLDTLSAPYVIKADGLAAGKGVHITETKKQAEEVIEKMLSGQAFGAAGKKIVIEKFLTGQEASFIALVSNGEIVPLVSSQDHKARDNNDTGPNTGGMGAYSPTPILDDNLSSKIINTIIKPTIETLKKHGINYSGFLFAGLMIDDQKNISVLEYNCRLGDPEAQVILPRLESDFFELCYLAATKRLNSNIKLQWTNKIAITVVLASRDYPGTPIKDEVITGLELIERLESYNKFTKVFHAATYRDEQDKLRTNGGRVLNFTTVANNLQDAQSLAYANIKHIKWPSLFYRTDIGQKAL